jgi:hypothetical protein
MRINMVECDLCCTQVPAKGADNWNHIDIGNFEEKIVMETLSYCEECNEKNPLKDPDVLIDAIKTGIKEWARQRN